MLCIKHSDGAPSLLLPLHPSPSTLRLGSSEALPTSRNPAPCRCCFLHLEFSFLRRFPLCASASFSPGLNHCLFGKPSLASSRLMSLGAAVCIAAVLNSVSVLCNTASSPRTEDPRCVYCKPGPGGGVGPGSTSAHVCQAMNECTSC